MSYHIECVSALLAEHGKCCFFANWLKNIFANPNIPRFDWKMFGEEMLYSQS
jgi:hypothetical protein